MTYPVNKKAETGRQKHTQTTRVNTILYKVIIIILRNIFDKAHFPHPYIGGNLKEKSINPEISGKWSTFGFLLLQIPSKTTEQLFFYSVEKKLTKVLYEIKSVWTLAL